MFAGVTGANGAQEQHAELLTYGQQKLCVISMLLMVLPKVIQYVTNIKQHLQNTWMPGEKYIYIFGIMYICSQSSSFLRHQTGKLALSTTLLC